MIGRTARNLESIVGLRMAAPSQSARGVTRVTPRTLDAGQPNVMIRA
jgi:hypothetical protein